MNIGGQARGGSANVAIASNFSIPILLLERKNNKEVRCVETELRFGRDTGMSKVL